MKRYICIEVCSDFVAGRSDDLPDVAVVSFGFSDKIVEVDIFSIDYCMDIDLLGRRLHI